MLHLIKAIVAVEPPTLTLKFNTGEELMVDLGSSLTTWGEATDSPYRQLLNPATFAQVELDPVMESIRWPNGIDLCPDTLYQLALSQNAEAVTAEQ